MKKVINKIFYYAKFVLFIIAFALSLYILLKMSMRLNKGYVDVVYTFIPYIILLLLFILNAFIRNKNINDNLFYNISCCLVFFVNIIVSLRSIFDCNMILNKIYGYSINFAFFNDYLSFNKILFYGLIIASIFFMFSCNKSK